LARADGGSWRSSGADGAGGTLPEKRPPAAKLWPRFFWVGHRGIGLLHAKIGGIWPWPARTGDRGDRPAPTALEEPCRKKGRRPQTCGPDFSGSDTVESGCFTRKSGVFGLGPHGRGIAAIDPRRRRGRNPAGKRAACRQTVAPIFLGRTPWNRAASRENRGYLALARADWGIAAIDLRRRRGRNPSGKKAAGRKPAGGVHSLLCITKGV